MTDQPTEAAREPLSDPDLEAIMSKHFPRTKITAGFRAIMREAIASDRAARALTQGEMAGWVSVEDRVPKSPVVDGIAGKFLVLYDCGAMDFDFWMGPTGQYGGRLCHWRHAPLGGRTVTHWMPLPAAPGAAAPSALVASPVEMQEPAWMAAFDEARDAILHDRHALAEEGMTNEQTNAVLTILDDAFMPHLKRGTGLQPFVFRGQMPPDFLEYVKRNYSGEVVFSDPLWHAVRLWRAAMSALDNRASLAAIPVAANQLTKDFPPMGGLTECDMGDSYE